MFVIKLMSEGPKYSVGDAGRSIRPMQDHGPAVPLKYVGS